MILEAVVVVWRFSMLTKKVVAVSIESVAMVGLRSGRVWGGF